MSCCEKIYHWQNQRDHGIHEMFVEKAASIEGKLTGLDIKNFKR
jgi:hypothetical protein